MSTRKTSKKLKKEMIEKYKKEGIHDGKREMKRWIWKIHLGLDRWDLIQWIDERISEEKKK